jgi:hypothetical protein
MGLPKIIYIKIQKVKSDLKVHAELAKYTNPEESIAKNIEKCILNIIYLPYLYLISSILGAIFIVIGAFTFCLVLLF